MRNLKTLKAGLLSFVQRFCMALLFIAGIGQTASAQQTGNMDPLLLPAPPELIAQMENQPHEYSEVKYFPLAKNGKEAGPEMTSASAEKTPNKVERMEALIAANERILKDKNADKVSKNKALRELRLQRLKLKIRAAEPLSADH